MIKEVWSSVRKSSLWILAPIGILAAFSCQDDTLVERQPVSAGNEIAFTVANDSIMATRSVASAPSVTHRQFLTTIGKDSLFLYTTIEENTDQPFGKSRESRAAQKTDETLKLNSFYVDAFYNGTTPFMNGTEIEWDSDEWTYSPLKYWPNNEGDWLDFYGYMDAPEYGKFDWTSGKKNEEFSYQLPDPQTDNKDATRQSDLIFAQALNQTKQSVNGRVVLNFYHALSAVLFKIGTLPDDITLTKLTITLQSVKNGGKCTIAQGENGKLKFTWTHADAGTSSYSQNFIKADGWKDDEDNGGKGKGDPISEIDDETAFMMIPQTFGEGASMKISFNIGEVVYEFNHPLVIGEGENAHTGWNPNTKYTYILTIEEYVEVEVREEFEQGSNVKENVRFQNTGLSNAYMRAAIVGYWVNESGDIVASWKADDEKVGTFTGLKGNAAWIKGTDGFYYHTKVVNPGNYTDELFTKYELTGNPPIVGASLELNIVVQAVKSIPTTGWSVTESNGVLTSK